MTSAYLEPPVKDLEEVFFVGEIQGGCQGRNNLTGETNTLSPDGAAAYSAAECWLSFTKAKRL
jgi:hypothetical protein